MALEAPPISPRCTLLKYRWLWLTFVLLTADMGLPLAEAEAEWMDSESRIEIPRGLGVDRHPLRCEVTGRTAFFAYFQRLSGSFVRGRECRFSSSPKHCG